MVSCCSPAPYTLDHLHSKHDCIPHAYPSIINPRHPERSQLKAKVYFPITPHSDSEAKSSLPISSSPPPSHFPSPHHPPLALLNPSANTNLRQRNHDLRILQLNTIRLLLLSSLLLTRCVRASGLGQDGAEALDAFRHGGCGDVAWVLDCGISQSVCGAVI